MMELLNVYRVQFVKREPIYVAASSMQEALTLISKDKKLGPEEGDEITAISHTPQHHVFV